MRTRRSASTRTPLNVRLKALIASLAVAVAAVVAPQGAAAYSPGIDNPGYEVGQLLTHDPSHPYRHGIVIGRVYLDRTQWLPGSRLKLTTVIDLSHPAFSPGTCIHSVPGQGSFTTWSGLNFLRYIFPAELAPGVAMPALEIADIQNPLTFRDRAPLVNTDIDTTQVGGNVQGIKWSKHTFLVGNSGALGETIRGGAYSFTFKSPVGSADLRADKLYTLIRPDLSVTLLRQGLPEENENVPGLPSGAECYVDEFIKTMLPGSLIAFGATTLQAAAPAVEWGNKPVVTATVTSADGVPTGSVTVTGPNGIKAEGTLAQVGSSAQAVISLPATLPMGTHTLTVTYPGLGGYAGATNTASLTVTKRTPALSVKVTKKPRPKKTGKATLTVTGLTSKPSGKVTVTLKKGTQTKTVTVSLKSAKATAKLPKLPKGDWTVSAHYKGDTRYAAVTVAAPAIRSK